MCYNETMKVFDALEAAAPDFRTPIIYKYIKEYDDCMEKEEQESKKKKTSTLHYLNQYLDQKKFKRK
jgi:translation initiation factor IF-2